VVQEIERCSVTSVQLRSLSVPHSATQGDLHPHMIPTALIDAMKNTTLLSVSQMCGEKIPLCGIFSPVDCRFFPFHQMLPYLKLVSENCDEVLRAKVENGLYVMESN
jgi:hypothetical protein